MHSKHCNLMPLLMSGSIWHGDSAKQKREQKKESCAIQSVGSYCIGSHVEKRNGPRIDPPSEVDPIHRSSPLQHFPLHSSGARAHLWTVVVFARARELFRPSFERVRYTHRWKRRYGRYITYVRRVTPAGDRPVSRRSRKKLQKRPLLVCASPLELDGWARSTVGVCHHPGCSFSAHPTERLM